MALTGKQQAFVTAYIENGMKNAAAAYRAAYPTSTKWTPQAVAHEAERLTRNPKIAPILEKARSAADQRLIGAIQDFAVTKEVIARELARIAFADPLLGITVPANVRSATWERLARLQGYIEDKSRVRVVRSLEDLSDDELAALAQSERQGEDTRH